MPLGRSAEAGIKGTCFTDVVLSKGLSIFQWTFTGSFQWMVSGTFQHNFTSVSSGV